jgi:hypothetical protein
MKYVLFLTLVFSYLISECQDAPKGTNAITVRPVAFETVVNALLDSGFKIDNIDKDFHTLSTKSYGDWNMILSVRVKDSAATISGTFRPGSYLFDIEQLWYPSYRGSNWLTHGKAAVKTFEWMDNFAKSFNGQVIYSKIKK